MTRNLKALGLALLAICALGAMAAQGASAATEHEFHAEQETAIVTGTSEETQKFAAGAAGTVECKHLHTESTQEGTKVSAGTYKADTATVIPHYTECTFGGQPATVNFNHCAYTFDSDTTLGNKTKEDEHANVEIKCANAGEKIEVHTATCTITVPPQLIKDAIKYKNIKTKVGEKEVKMVTVETTAEKINVGKVRNTATQPMNGCLLFPAGEVATYTGRVENECFEDLGTKLEGTDRTTPLTKEGELINCTVSPGA